MDSQKKDHVRIQKGKEINWEMETNPLPKEGPICQVLIGGNVKVTMQKASANTVKAVVAEGHGPVWFSGMDNQKNRWAALVYVTGPVPKLELGMEQPEWLHRSLNKRYENLMMLGEIAIA